jgi:hypothetical protein
MACKCDVGLGNTGLPGCQPIASVAKKLIVVPTYSDAGTKNGILLTDTLDQTYFDGKVNAADASERWFPLPAMENITHERADSIVETAGSGRTAFIREGLKTFTGEMWKQSPAFLGKLKEAKCVDISVFIVDNDGNLIGSCPTEDGYLYPIQVDKNSWDARTVEATDTTIQKVALNFNWSDDEKDEDIRMVTADEYTGNVLALKGLLDIIGKDGAADETSDTLTISLETIYGSKASPVKIKGLAIGDFSFLASGAGAIVPSGMVETNGTYVFTFADLSLNAGETVNVTVSKNGYDSTLLTAIDITVA